MPDWLAEVLREIPVSMWRAVMVAPMMTPSLGSEIVPVRVAVGVSACRVALVRAQSRQSIVRFSMWVIDLMTSQRLEAGRGPAAARGAAPRRIVTSSVAVYFSIFTSTGVPSLVQYWTLTLPSLGIFESGAFFSSSFVAPGIRKAVLSETLN